MKLRRLIKKENSQVNVRVPVNEVEINQRSEDYNHLNTVQFSRKYGHLLYEPVGININGVSYNIQANYCINPFCKWYGLWQHKYTDFRHSPSRYTIIGKEAAKAIRCNSVNDNSIDKPVITSYTTPLSNWGLAEEIKRLIDVNSIENIEPEYIFHKEGCSKAELNPFDNQSDFYKRGKSSSNSQKYQCKECKKMTNVLPSQRECFTYNQKRNEILPLFMKLILSRTPVTRICEILNIGISTYYNKLEWVYRRCLEFLEKHETRVLAEKQFDTLWLNSDKFVYTLNNVRKKGHGNKSLVDRERPTFPTMVIATSDSFSRYVFRADVSFDYSTTIEEVINDINLYKEDKLYSHLQKTSRYRFSKISTNDELTDEEQFLINLEYRKEYVDGLHVNSTYTSFAHHWLLNNRLNAKKFYMVCDDDLGLIGSALRNYKERISNRTMNVFTCKVDKSLNKSEAFGQYVAHKNEVSKWKKTVNPSKSMKESAIDLLANKISMDAVFKKVSMNDKEYTIGVGDAIEHPYPFKDEGNRFVNCVTDLSYLSETELAQLLYKVDLRSIDTFFNQLRRKVSILERPLSGGRGEGKSYIYTNFNPKYAQYMITILRTYLNFCETYKYKGEEVTPAMNLGIAKKIYTIKNILYLK